MSKKRFLKTKMALIILLLLNIGAYAQVKVITGTVNDDQGKPLAKATVTAKGAESGVTTSSDGHFRITVPESTTILVISYVGFDPEEVNVKDKSNVDVTLKASPKRLEEVIVQTGYGSTQKVKDVTGAISQVKGSDVKNLATQDVATLLQGRVAGVEVVSASGQPGQSGQIKIRGVSSLNNADPLYVIDGVIQPAGGSNINPQDIETMTVLKDASAAAIYGAKAAGGVILITTKKGRGTTPTINFSTRYGITTPEVINLLDKDDFVKYKQGVKDGNYSNPANAAEIAAFIPIDWNKELYRNGQEQNYSLSVSGSSPNINYFLSGLYNSQEGVFLDNASSFGAARINTDIKISNSIKIGEQMSVWSRYTVPVKTPLVSTPFESQPVFEGGPAYSSVPGVASGVYPFNYNAGVNPVAQIKEANFEFPSNSFQGQAYVEIRLPIKYLTFRSTIGYTSQTYQNNLLQNQYSTNGLLLPDSTGQIQNHLYRNIGSYQQVLLADILSYDHMWGKHTINLLAGYEQYSSLQENLMADVKDVNGTSYAYFLSSESKQYGGTNVAGGYDPNGLVKSIFGRINYDFNKLYYLTVTVRRDGNFTVFGQDDQFGVFPSVSSGWNISEERFFKKYRNVVNQLKLRGSYGQLGNSQIGNYNFATTYNQGIVQNFSPNSAPQASYTQQNIANQDVHWETTTETNIGVDGQMLNGKIYFTVDWYNKATSGLLFQVPVSYSSGVVSSGQGFTGGSVSPGPFLENIGNVQNRGVDIAVGYNGKAGQVNYSIGGTGSFNTNKVVNLVVNNGLPDGFNSYPYGSSIWAGQTLTRTFVGDPFGQFWGLKEEGIYKENDPRLATAPNHNGNAAQAGDFIFYDRNHDGIIDQNDDSIIGNPYPKFTFGVNITASWKNFDVALLFNGALGVQLYNGVAPYEYESLDGSNVTSKVFQTSGFSNGTTTNGITNYAAIGHTDGFGNYKTDPYGNYSTPSSYFVENGSYVKLKNIQLGYSLSTKLLQKVKIKSLRIYVMANNVFTITKYTGVDPELGSQYAILSLDKNGNVIGNADGSSNYAATNNSGIVGNATTSRGIDSPQKYPNVKLYAAGIDLTF